MQEYFRALVLDIDFQATASQDQIHKIFLHQAVLSALLTKFIPSQKLRLLPPEYNYPLHLHREVPEDRQAKSLNSLVNPVYEDIFEYPQILNGIPVADPLNSWFSQNVPMKKLARRS